MSKYTQTIEIIKTVRAETESAMLYHSIVGKDSIALLDMIAPYFSHITCVFMYLVPGMKHIQEYMDWASYKYPNIDIIQVPGVQRFAMKKYGFFCLPDDSIKKTGIGDIEERVRQITGLKYAFNGMKGVDGYMKRMRLKRFARTGYITDKGMVYPLALWTNKEVQKYIDERGLKKPFIYEEGKVSQGLTPRIECLNSLRERFPKDYELFVRDFPFVEKLFFDYGQE